MKTNKTQLIDELAHAVTRRLCRSGRYALSDDDAPMMTRQVKLEIKLWFQSEAFIKQYQRQLSAIKITSAILQETKKSRDELYSELAQEESFIQRHRIGLKLIDNKSRMVSAQEHLEELKGLKSVY